jgi:hypothetical protein
LKSLILNFSLGQHPYPDDENLKYFTAEYVKKLSKKAFKKINPEYKNFLEEILKKIED